MYVWDTQGEKAGLENWNQRGLDHLKAIDQEPQSPLSVLSSLLSCRAWPPAVAPQQDPGKWPLLFAGNPRLPPQPFSCGSWSQMAKKEKKKKTRKKKAPRRKKKRGKKSKEDSKQQGESVF